MIRHINEKIFKNKKFKLFAATIAMAIGLTGCGITNHNNNSTNTATQQSTSIVTQDEQNYTEYDVEFHFSNWDRELQIDETIFFTDKNGTIYDGATINENGITETKVMDLGGKFISHNLQQAIEIPDINEDEKIIVNVDYKEKTMETEVVQLAKTK